MQQKRLVKGVTKLLFFFGLFFLSQNYVYGESDTYIIKSGDNLWLISEKFFKDPYKWLDLWKINPSVTDPHWIYPGNSLKIPFKQMEEKSAQIQKDEKGVETQNVKKGVETEQAEKPKELVIQMEEPKEIEVEKESKPKFKKYIVDVMNIDRLAFFSEKPLKEFFTIISSEERRRFGDKDSKFFIDGGEIKGLKKDDNLMILRPLKELKDEKNNRIYGHIYSKIGTSKVIDVYPQTAVIKILKSYAEVEKGDMLIFQPEKDNPEVVIKKANVFLEGSILEVQEGLFFIGERNFVILDKGKKDGLERGDVLKIEKQIDGVTDKYVDIGRLIVIKNWENFSAGYVLEVRDVAGKGDRFSTYIEGY